MTHLRIKHAWRGGGPGGAPGWLLETEYDEDAVEALKAAIPPFAREWDPAHERWWVHEGYEAALLALAPGLAAYKSQGSLFA